MLVAKLLTISFVACALLSGCSNQRALYRVQHDGESALKAGDYAKAEADFFEYIKRKPEAHQLRYDLARAYIADKRPLSAIQELNIALDVQPLNDDYMDLQAQAMYEANERDALTTLLRRNASERGRVSDYIRLGTYSAKMGNADEAKESLLIAAKLDGGNTIKPQLALADFYASVGDHKSQTRRLRMAYFLDPTNKNIIDALTALGEKPAPGFGLKPEEYVIPDYTAPAKPAK
jgi:tetratricopeptide (TPR) repeat protein